MKGLNLLELDPETYPNLRELGEKQRDWIQEQPKGINT